MSTEERKRAQWRAYYRRSRDRQLARAKRNYLERKRRLLRSLMSTHD